MPLHTKDLQTRIRKLQDRIDTARGVIADDARTKRQVIISVQHIERMMRTITKYSSYEPINADFDYEKLTTDILEQAEECLIDLKGFQQELEESFVTVEKHAAVQKAKIQFSACNIKVTIPKFKGDYAEYPKFKSAFTTVMLADGKSKPEQLRVLEQHLEGRPLTLIGNLPPTDAGFDTAMNLLDETFDSRERQKQAILAKIKRMPQATDELLSIRNNYEEIESLLRALNSYEDIDNNDELRRIVMSKYSVLTLDRISPTEIPTLQTVRERVKQIVRTKEDIDDVFQSLSLIAPKPNVLPTISVAAMPIEPKQAKKKASTSNEISRQSNTNARPNTKTETEGSCCLFCNRTNHVSEDCKMYPTAAKRIEKLPAFTCHICCNVGHIRQNCPFSANRCKICESRYHHTALCPTKYGYFKKKPQSDQNPRTATETIDTKAMQELSTKDSPKTTIGLLLKELHSSYLTARAQIRNPIKGRIMNVRIFLDCGCPRTFILNRVAENMEFTTIEKANLAIGVFLHPEVEELKTKKIKLEIIDPNTNEPHVITASTVPRITDNIGVTDIAEFCARYPQLQNLNLATETDNDEVTLLIGNDYLWKFILPEKKIELDDDLYLINTSFGYMIVGNRENERTNTNLVKTMHVTTKFITALWSLDAIGIQDKNLTESEEEENALQQFNATIRYIPNEKRFNQELLILEPHEERQHYLPYHFVEREGKSTPIRVIYNGSAKTKKSNLSLNETLYKGVNLLTDMVGILLRFRLRPIAVISDVEKAFHQITLIPEHRDYVRFLWTEDYETLEDNKIITYRFRRIPFGVISSPFILAATILHHLNRYSTSNAERIRNDIYADNIITTFTTETEAIEFYHEATKIFNEAGMPLRQWQSNSPQVRHAIKSELRDMNEQVTILGLNWNTNTNVITLKIPKELQNPTEVTMLTVLQISSQIYDPLGFFAPVSIRSRILLQRLHSQKYEWETPLNKEERSEWSEIYADLIDLQNFAFRRTITESRNQIKSLQLHIFTDASIKAYAAAIYLRIETTAQTTVHLLIAKSRVTPLQSDNRLTIPRLELMAAVIGSRLIRKITSTLSLKPEPKLFHWIDSRCVLSWLCTNAVLPIFVRNRISEIKKIENVSYRYVPSENNPADLASRGIPTADLHDPTSLWWHGPDWLEKNDCCWPPSTPPVSDCDPNCEEPRSQAILTACEKEKQTTMTPFAIKVQNFRSYRALIRTTAFCIQFLRKHTSEKILQLFPNEEVAAISYATRLWIKSAQENAFTETIQLLKEKRKSDMIKRLRLFLDDEGIICAAGRFHYAPLTFEEKNPILLPKPLQDKMVWLLVLHIHEIRMHAGVAATLSALRKRYWIPSGRKQTANVLRKCHACKKENAKPYKQPEESILPMFRLQAKIEAFSHVGLDIVGHFWVRKLKKWILVVTCLVTRAVALEDLENLEANTTMFALQRIQAPTTNAVFYLSDNAQQFLVIKAIIEKNTTKEFQWKFLPAFMPWAGGVYERLMKLIKASLNATFRAEVNVSDTQFRTIIQQIAGVLNQRPLSFQGEEFDGTPLTPNDLTRIHFSPDEPNTLIMGADSTVIAYLKHNMKANRDIVNHFWDIWSRDYLQFLRERSATMKFMKRTNQFEPKIGDVVLLHDPILKQRNWHLVVVHQLQRSEDNSVRSAVVRLGTGTKVVRPVEKLYFMELNEFEDQGEPIPQGDSIEPNNGIQNVIIVDDPTKEN